MDSSEIVLSEEVAHFSKLTFVQKCAYAKQIFVDAIPMMSAYLIPVVTNTISLIFLTNYRDDEIVAGFGLGSTFNAVVALSWIFSFNQAASVYISQAFGAKDYPACGRFFRRGLTIALPLLIPVAALLIFSDKLMIVFGITEVLAKYAHIFTEYSIPFLLGSCFFDSMKAFVMAQEVFHPVFYIQAVTLVLHFVWAKIFIDYLHWGIEGAVVCRTIEEWSNAIVLYIYIRKSGRFDHTWGSWDKEVFKLKELWNQFQFAISIAAAGYLDWLYWEVLTLIAGTFDARETVVHVGLVTTATVEYALVSGATTTLIVFIGISLGQRSITKAKNYAYAGYCVLIGMSVCFVLILLILQKFWVAWWSADPLTQEGLLRTVQLYNFGLLTFNAFNAGLLAVLKCTGYQKMALITVVVLCYILGIPFILFLAVKMEMKVFGIWLAYDIIQFAMLIVNAINVWRIDWNEVLKNVYENLKGPENGEETLPLKED